MSTPPRKKIDVFTDKLYGIFGRFRTTESYEVNYLLSNLHIHDLNRLTIAKAALDFASIRFEDMMQRDVDYERVDEKIIGQYLAKGKGRILFFPPIIVSVVAVEDEKVIDLYESVNYQLPSDVKSPTDVQDDSELSIIFDKDKFCIKLALSNDDTGYKLPVNGSHYNYYPTSTTFEYNKRKIRLIVIDGQHRFEALRRLVEKKSDLVDAIELPICIVFTPEARKENNSSESIVRDLREMFVTINTTAKEVSGHFVDLLEDKSLASIAVRSLANYWKMTDDKPWRCMLHQIEWNERQKSRANTVQKNYAVSTVSILSEALRNYVFGSSSENFHYALLDLDSVEDALESVEGSIKAYSIEENKFDSSQKEILQGQIEKFITPALNRLLTQPRPYKERRDNFMEAVKWLDLKVEQGSDTALAFREVLSEFRRCTKQDGAKIRSFQEEFDEKIYPNDDDRVYFLNIFQQAFIGVWSDLSYLFRKELSLTPEESADILVSLFERVVFNPRSRFFDREMPYVSPVLYNGSKLAVTQSTKSIWKNLLKSSLLEKKTQESLRLIVKKYDEIKFAEVMEKITDSAEIALNEYCGALYKKISSTVSKEWQQRPYDRGLKDKLEKLSQDKESYEEYQKEIGLLIDTEYKEATEKLGNKLGLDLTSIVNRQD